MDDMDPSKRIKRLEDKIRVLALENRAWRAQGRLFERLIEMAGSAPDKGLLKVSMQRTLVLTAQLSGTDTGSLFLLNDRGKVTDSLLTRGEVSPDTQSRLIGSVLDQGLAGWVKTHLDVGLVHDIQSDPRWLSLPSEPYVVRSALSVPIIRHKNLFGIITLMHPEPGHFSQESVEIVRAAADQMAIAIEMARLYIKSEELNHLKKKAEDRDLALARQVQESFLPSHLPRVDGWAFAALTQPAHAVGGDFYHFFNLPQNRVGMAIGDVSGKGIAAALFMAKLTSDLQYHVALDSEPATLFNKINTILCERSQQGMFVTMIYMILETDTGDIFWVNAGHPAPLYRDETGVYVLEENEKKGPPIGIFKEASWKVSQASLTPGAGILMYTDGVIEAGNPASGLFGPGRLKRIMRRYADAPAVLVRQISRAVERFSPKNSRTDDLTLVTWTRKSG
jgi:phosphoserine phosphatase RsbU/P